MKAKLFFILAVVLNFGFMQSCAQNPTEPDTNTRSVSILSNRFSPSSLTISVGERVTWTNNDNTTHSVDSGTFMNATTDFEGSPNIDAGASYTVRFTVRGSFPYYCVLHQSTVKEGTITVN